jgi:hypothetical protein
MEAPMRAANYVVPILIASVVACGAADAGGELRLQPLDSPAAAGSSEPNLTERDGVIRLSWLEPRPEGGHSLRFATLRGDGWDAPRTISEGDGWFVNWADFPSLVALSDDRLAAHWLVRSGPGTYAYDVHVSQSADGGESWTPSVVPHRDGTQTEHGFVSLFPWEDGNLAAIWLDGRNFVGAEGHGHDAPGGGPDMMLKHTTFTADGTPTAEVLLDPRICDCCQTSVALTSRGPLAVYRDRSADEVRDISVVRYVDGRWTEPRPVHRDEWRIPGCPVNGPAVTAEGDRVAVAWFTAADDEPRVQIAFSDDAGESFDAPLRVDGGDPIGRVDVIMLADGDALVSWVERAGDGAEIRLRRMRPQGGGTAWSVAATSAARASGFPRMALGRDRLVLAWTEPGTDGGDSHVRTAVARLR